MARTTNRVLSSREIRAAGFEEPKHLSGNIGYLDIRSFQNIETGTAIIAAMLEFFAGTDSLVIDLRRHEGGDRAAASLLASHFFDTEPVHLDAVYWTNARRLRTSSTAIAAGSRYVGRAIFLLIGARSSGVAVEFARMLNAMGRVTIVGDMPVGAVVKPDLAVCEAMALLAAHRAALQRMPSVA